MGYRTRRVEYFHATVKERPGEPYALLSRLAGGRVNLLAFTAVPVGPVSAQLTLFPDETAQLARVAEEVGVVLDGPHHALLVQGDDKMGAIAEIHARLARADVRVFASSGVADGKGCYGYLLYLRPEQIDSAAAALQA